MLSLSDFSAPPGDSYNGLIYQCADMAYEEFKNKYEELRWLMVTCYFFFKFEKKFDILRKFLIKNHIYFILKTGDNVSSTSKLKVNKKNETLINDFDLNLI